MRAADDRQLGARSRDPLRAGAAERDRRHPPALDDHAGLDRHSRRADAGRDDAGGHGRRRDRRDPRGLRGHDPAGPRHRRADHALSRHLADLLRRALRRRRGRRAAASDSNDAARRRMRWRWRSPSRRPASGTTTPPPPRAGSPSAMPPATGSPRRSRRNRDSPPTSSSLDGNFFSGIYGVTPDVAALTDGLGERARAERGLVQAVVRGAPDHGGDAGAQGDHRERRRARESSTRSAAVLPPHLKMIDHGVVAGDRASHLTSVQYCMAVAALAPGAGVRRAAVAAGAAAGRARLHGQDQGRGGREPARGLSAHLAGARARRCRLGAARAAGDPCPRRSGGPFDRAPRAGEVSAIRLARIRHRTRRAACSTMLTTASSGLFARSARSRARASVLGHGLCGGGSIAGSAKSAPCPSMSRAPQVHHFGRNASV